VPDQSYESDKATVFVHETAICESEQVGSGTRIWAFAHVLAGAEIGRDCNLSDHVFVENDVKIGERVTIKSGVQVCDRIRIGDDVLIGPQVTFTNDRYPRSKQDPGSLPETIVGDGASIGANATILPGISIGSGAMVGAGAVVTRDVPPQSIVVGNPARIIGYDSADRLTVGDETQDPNNAPLLGVGETRLWPIRHVRDLRGSLAVAEFDQDLPFMPQRAFTVYDVPSERVRGEHAHRWCEQFLVAVSGSLHVLVDDGRHRSTVILDRPSVGLYIPPMIWGSQFRFSSGTVLLVFASHPYDPDDYIRSYDEFSKLTKPGPEGSSV